jgi:outer membrane receptor protein involved in Fe transport
MEAETIGYTPADELIGNVVPYSPERMASGGIGYTIKHLGRDGNLRIGLNMKWWDEYYCNEENRYSRPVQYIDEEGNYYYQEETFSSKLPYFFTIGAEAKYEFRLMGSDCMLKLDFNNINNREENYNKGYVGTDYGRNDYLLDEKNLYVVPAPLFNIASTFEIKF